MRRPLRFAAAAVLSAAALAVAGCASDDSDDDGADGATGSTTVGDCVFAPGAQCQDADLSGVSLNGDDAQGGNFTGADFSDAELEGVNLSRTDLTSVTFEGATLDNVDLSSANLTEATLEGATLTGVNLDGTVLCMTIRTDGTTDDTGCPFSGTTTMESTTTEGTTTESTTTDGTTTDSGTTTSAGGAPTIDSFDVPSTAGCEEGEEQKNVGVEWEASDATGVELAVDGEAPGAQAGLEASGSADVTVPCDGEDHEISLTAFNSAGETATESATIGT